MSRQERFGTITDIKLGPTIRKSDPLNDKINSGKSNQRSKIYHGSDRNFDTDR